MRCLLTLTLALCVLTTLPAQAKECKKGKKPCGNKCISARKVCKEDAAPAQGAQGGPTTAEDQKTLASASDAAVAAALQTQAGRALIELARALRKTGDLDLTDEQRSSFKQALRGAKPPLAICSISHIQLVRDCEPLVGGTVSLPCYLATDEMAEVCKLVGSPMPQMK